MSTVYSMRCSLDAPAQTELISHCEDIPVVREVLQEDGKLLLQTLLEVRYFHISTVFISSSVIYRNQWFQTDSLCISSQDFSVTVSAIYIVTPVGGDK